MSENTEAHNGCVMDVKFCCTAFWTWRSCYYFEQEPCYRVPVCRHICEFECTCKQAIAAAKRKGSA